MTAVDALRQFIEAYDAFAVRMDSNTIGEIGDFQGNYRPHPWHEEWLRHARAALAAAEKDEGELVAALTDIANGNVPPGFLNAALASPNFHESLVKWCQDLARDAVAKHATPEHAKKG